MEILSDFKFDSDKSGHLLSGSARVFCQGNYLESRQNQICRGKVFVLLFVFYHNHTWLSACQDLVHGSLQRAIKCMLRIAGLVKIPTSFKK